MAYHARHGLDIITNAMQTTHASISSPDAARRFTTTLKDSGYSSTSARRLVFHKLAEGPIAHAELASALSRTIDRATAYRALDLFERLGIINRVHHGTTPRVELSEVFLPHHHHATCQRCGKVVDLSSSELETAISAMAKRQNFLAVEHSVELIGYCSDCHGR